MSAGPPFKPGDRVRVVNPQYGTFGQVGLVTEPDEFWTFGPCVVLDGHDLPGAYLAADLEYEQAESPAAPPAEDTQPAPPRRALAPRAAREPPDPPAPREAEYGAGLRDGWSQAVRHIAHHVRVEGGVRSDPGAIAPDVSGLIAGIIARVEAAETRALAAGTALERRDDRMLTVLPPEAAPAFSANTLTMLIQAVSEIVIQERERARLHWEAKLAEANSRADRERGARHRAETALADLRLRAEAAEPPAALRDAALMDVLSCAEEFISGAALNRALVLHALRETLGNLRQVSALDTLRGPGTDAPKRLR